MGVINMRFRFLVLAVSFLSITAVSGCSEQCSSELVKTSRSPTGLIEAGFFKKNCGATTGFVYELRVGDASDDPSSRKLVLRFDDQHQIDWPADDKNVLNLSWPSDNALDVTIAKPVRIFKQIESSGNTVIRFRLRPGSTNL
jgi:hypothetical protein